MKINLELLDRIGRMADKADNFTHAGLIPMPAEIHKTCLLEGMADIRLELREIYKEISGEDPWNES